MILPILRAMNVTMISWSSHLAGHLPLSLIVNFLVTMLVMAGYTRAFIFRAFTNYIDRRVTDMETLIALGSISAFSLLLFILGEYTIEYANGTIDIPNMLWASRTRLPRPPLCS
jgi:cation transport ATPase